MSENQRWGWSNPKYPGWNGFIERVPDGRVFVAVIDPRDGQMFDWMQVHNLSVADRYLEAFVGEASKMTPDGEEIPPPSAGAPGGFTPTNGNGGYAPPRGGTGSFSVKEPPASSAQPTYTPPPPRQSAPPPKKEGPGLFKSMYDSWAEGHRERVRESQKIRSDNYNKVNDIAAAYKVQCPACDAPKHRKCVSMTYNRNQLSMPHVDRIKLAKYGKVW